MKIRLKEYVVQFVRNLSVHCGRKLLPYGAILAVLGGIGFFWDGGPAEEKADMREKIHADDGSSPSFSATAQHQDSKNKEGTLIFSTAAARRRKPLPELFVPPPVSAAEKTSAPVTRQGNAADLVSGQPSPAVRLPVVSGRMDNSGATLIILSFGDTVKACAEGEYFGGFYISYISPLSVILERDGSVWEIRG